MNKKIMFSALLLFSLSSVPALTLDEIINAANSVSYEVKNAELSHANSLLQIEESDIDDEALWSVEAAVTPLSSNDLSSDSFDIGTLNASVTLPNDGKTAISVSSPLAFGYDGAFSISPGVRASHTFDFNYFDEDRITDLSNARSRISTERVYYSALYSFNQSVIAMVSNILTVERGIKSYEHSIRNAEREISNMLSLRSATEESISYKRAKLEADNLKRSLENYQDQYEKAKEQFKAATGLDWDGLEPFDLPSLNLSVMENGNSEVMEYSLDSEIARLSVEEKEKAMDPMSLLVGGGLGMGIKNEKGKARYDSGLEGALKKWEDTISADLSADLSLSNWSLGASFSASSPLDSLELTPKLTISGSWKNNTALEADRLELERLRNSAVGAENDYLDSLTSYNIEGRTLENRILDFNFRMLNATQNEEYLRSVLEREKEYYGKGLIRIEDVEDAEFNLSDAEYETLITSLDGLSLYYDLLIYSL